MAERAVGGFAFGSFYRSGQLPSLANADDPFLTADAILVQGIDGCTNTVRCRTLQIRSRDTRPSKSNPLARSCRRYAETRCGANRSTWAIILSLSLTYAASRRQRHEARTDRKSVV